MYRRLSSRLPEDPTFPADLKELGYYVTPDDEIKSIEHPTDFFQFWITNNDRYNDVQREAMHACIRELVTTRLGALNINPLHLPHQTPTVPPLQSLPILCNQPAILRQKSRIIVIHNRIFEDLAILSYRILSKAGGIAHGSMIAIVQAILARYPTEEEAPGIIIMNPGQLLYSHKSGRAMTAASWEALPRKSAVHPAPERDAERNSIPGNRTVEEHLTFVFDNILMNSDYVNPSAELYLLGLGDGGDELIKHLEKNWTGYSSALQIVALALTSPLPLTSSTPHIPLTNRPFLSFLAQHARAWALSEEPLNSPLGHPAVTLAPSSTSTNTLNSPTTLNIDKDDAESSHHAKEDSGYWETEVEEVETPLFLYETVSGGEALHAECVLPVAFPAVVDWFGKVALERKGVVV